MSIGSAYPKGFLFHSDARRSARFDLRLRPKVRGYVLSSLVQCYPCIRLFQAFQNTVAYSDPFQNILMGDGDVLRVTEELDRIVCKKLEKV